MGVTIESEIIPLILLNNIESHEAEQKEEHIQKLITKEKDRTTLEKYSYTQLRGWGYTVPSLMALAFFVSLRTGSRNHYRICSLTSHMFIFPK